ncbi:TonB-dependent receptor [candidate division KSB1 bacterium]|nr:TonB-dependent receptor [candidate division KSB1 bacterium]
MKSSIFTIFSFLLIYAAYAQNTGTLIGRVVDEHDRFLPGANVILPDLTMGDATDQNGEFRIDGIPVGSPSVMVLFMGFQTAMDTVTILPDRITMLNVSLQPGVIELDELLVVGERLKGQAKALNQQKTNFNVSNIVSADQVGRFPDQNVGDALKRIPAMSVNYNQGEARYVNIRGAGPRLNAVLIDGERIPSADGETRAVQLDLIPAEMIQSVQVNKTVTPDMDADAIGGSVNLVTRQAPYFRRFSATLGSGYNVLRGKASLNGSFVAGKRFYNEQLGVVVSGSYYDFNLGSHNTEGIWDISKNGDIYPSQWDVRQYEIRRLRQSISFATDYRPNENNRYSLVFIYNHRDDWENRLRLRYRLEKPNEEGFSKDSEIRRQTKGGPNDNRFDNARLEDQRTNNLRLKGKHNVSNGFQIEWTLSHGRAWERRPRERYIAWWVKDVPVHVDLLQPRTPYFYENAEVKDFVPEEFSEEYRGTEERDTRLKIDVDIPLVKKGRFESLLFTGGKLKYKTKWRQQDFVRMRLTDLGEDSFSDMTVSETRDFTQANFMAGNYRIGRFTTYEYLGALDFNNDELFRPRRDLDEYIAGNYDAAEDVSSAYIMLDQELGTYLDMKIGARMEQTDITYNGYAYFEEEKHAVPTQGSDHYTNWLPGVHFKYEPTKQLVLRFAWTNTLSRPNYYDLVPYRAVSRGGDVLEIGNPHLRPTTSHNVDIMGEYYYESIGILSLGLFGKEINNFIYIHKQRDYDDPVTGNEYEEFFQPRNGADASLLGFEIAYQRHLGFLPGFLANLVLYMNYTFIDSKANSPTFQQKDINLPGAAPHTFNINVTYETRTLLLGLSYNYTSPYLDPDELDLTPGLERYYDKVTYLDFNASCTITPQMRFYVEANNLLNQPLRYYAGHVERTYQQEFYGFRATAGFKYDL